MRKPTAMLIYGGIGLTSFGVAYDSGFLGTPDGRDHSAVFAPPAATSSVSQIIGAGYSVVNNITGDEVMAPLPSHRPAQQDT
jgi:hypothetical protein